MRIIAIAFKDLLRSARSLFLVGMTLVAPLLITGLLYFAFGSLASGEVSLTTIHVGVVNADVLPADAPIAAPLGDAVRAVFFDDSVNAWIDASDYADEAAARAALNTQAIGVAVLIPPTFTAAYLAGETPAPITILQDPTLSIGPMVVRDIVTAVLDGVTGGGVTFKVIAERMAVNGLALEVAGIPALFERYALWYADFQRALFHSPETAALMVVSPTTGGAASNNLQALMGLVMAGQLVFFSFFTGANAMMSILHEDEEGTLARLFTTPIRRTHILAGKFLAVALTVLIQGVSLLLAGRLIFGIQWGEPGALALALVGQMFAAVGLGVMLVSFIRASRQAGPIFGGGLTVLGMLGGLFTTNIPMPAAFTAIANFTPQGWVLKAWRLSLAGQPPSELLGPFLVLTTMGVVMFVIGAVVFRKRFA